MLEDANIETFETGATLPEAASRMNSVHGDEVMLLPLVTVVGTLCPLPSRMTCFAEYLSSILTRSSSFYHTEKVSQNSKKKLDDNWADLEPIPIESENAENVKIYVLSRQYFGGAAEKIQQKSISQRRVVE